MLRQIKQLTAVQLCNVFGINEVIHTKDPKQRHRFILLAVTYIALLIMLIVYIAVMSSGLIMLGMGDIIPIYLFTITSMIILFFSFFKASHVIFETSTFELLISLPVSKTAIIVSRFLTMYSTNVMMSFFVMVTGAAVYGVYVHPGVSFYLYVITGILFLPLLPMTIATAIGAAITAVSSRMKHKSMVTSMLTILLVIALIAGNMIFSNRVGGMTEDMVADFVSILTAQIQAMYPPAVWFEDAAVNGNIGSFLLFLGVSIAVFVLLVAVVQRYFLSICTALHASAAKNNYTMQSLHTSSIVKALWKRELKRYFASSIYVSNTMTGYILMAVAGIALFFVGEEIIESTIGIPDITEKALPIVLGAVGAMMPTTSCSISMEGKQWWIAQTLPVRNKDVFDSKILVNLSVALPFYVVAVISGWLALRPSFAGSIWLIVMPLMYILFSAVVGITINLAVPVMNWDNETRVVKQSASTMITLLVEFASFAPPLIILIAVQSIPVDIVMAVTLLVLASLTAILYRRNNKRNLFL